MTLLSRYITSSPCGLCLLHLYNVYKKCGRQVLSGNKIMNHMRLSRATRGVGKRSKPVIVMGNFLRGVLKSFWWKPTSSPNIEHTCVHVGNKINKLTNPL